MHCCVLLLSALLCCVLLLSALHGCVLLLSALRSISLYVGGVAALLALRQTEGALPLRKLGAEARGGHGTAGTCEETRRLRGSDRSPCESHLIDCSKGCFAMFVQWVLVLCLVLTVLLPSILFSL